MGTSFQVVFDCADPDRLARFYAGALHYKLQEPPAGYDSWEAFLKAQGVPESEWNSASAIVDPEKRGARIYFQRMDTPKPAKNRLHLDINASRGSSVPVRERKAQVDAEVTRILGMGATKVWVWEDSDEYWVALRDPEGNEFDIQ
jgi:hypothetical protein